MKFAVIGAGMMGSAIITGIVNNNVLKAEEIFISDPDTGKCEQLKARLGVNIAASNAEAVSGADAVLVAVKPQFLAGALQAVKGGISPDAG